MEVLVEMVSNSILEFFRALSRRTEQEGMLFSPNTAAGIWTVDRLTHLTQNVPKAHVNQAWILPKPSGRCVTSKI